MRMIAFDGMQPTLMQVPPISPRSISATFAPRFAASLAAVKPAGPAPMTRRLYGPLGSGFFHSGGWAPLISSMSWRSTGKAVAMVRSRDIATT
ncbi:hypothetical protein [Mesorhizobium sp. M0047]|uniref:hypothetical protein n=1 Tax=Mesorhizobium sp. M0047 TaxID=2956859 RepID=UPI00333D07E0